MYERFSKSWVTNDGVWATRVDTGKDCLIGFLDGSVREYFADEPEAYRIVRHHARGPERIMVEIGGEKFEADRDFTHLLRALNGVGLKTTQHCAGHPGTDHNVDGEEGNAYLSIEITPDMVVAIRNETRPRLLIRWNREV